MPAAQQAEPGAVSARKRNGQAPSGRSSRTRLPPSERRGARRHGRQRRAPTRRMGARADRSDPVDLLEEQAAHVWRSSCRSATSGCWCRRSRSSAARPTRWRRTWPARPDRLRGPALRRRAPVELRRLRRARPPAVFGINDFDETLPGPFEWDVKRLVASFAVAGRDRGFDAKSDARSTRGGRALPRGHAGASPRAELDLWYSRLDVDEIARARGAAREPKGAEAVRAQRRQGAIEGQHASVREAHHDGRRRARIVSDPPLIVPIEEVASGVELRGGRRVRARLIRSYRRTLTADRRRLLERYRYVQAGRKVVGVGSVGTRAWIVLMLGRDDSDPLFLQIKEAQASVLEPFLGKSTYAKHGQRVVEGQRLTQAASDILLGWIRSAGLDGVERDFYVRQLWDGKGSALVEPMEPRDDAHLCGDLRLRRWRRPTPARATRSRSRAISAGATASTAPWRHSPRPTPTRTSATTTR